MREKICLICNKAIPAERLKSNRVKYCSEACARKAEAHKRMKQIAKKTNSLKSIADTILIVYDSKCAICGWRLADKAFLYKDNFNKSLGCEIHHIKPVKDGGANDFTNCILLCPNHHKAADWGVISQEELKTYLLSEQEIEKRLNDFKQNAMCKTVDAVANAIL